jgi:YVTN family beta-propeller protein
VPISTRGSEVEISPDGRYAYVAVVASGDGAWRIDLATNTVAGAKLATADMGGTTFMFGQASGMTLSHDGKVLALCGSFTNQVTLIDTAAWSVVANVAVGTFPVKAVFSSDDTKLYVANKNANSISVVNVAGAGSNVGATLPVGAAPFELAVDTAAQLLYVAEFNDKRVRRVDLVGGSSSTIALADFPQGLRLSPTGSCLYVASGNWTVSLGPGPLLALGRSGAVTQIDTATFSVSQSVDTGTPPATLELDAAGGLGLVPVPLGDGLTRIDLSTSVTTYCTAKVNSLGCAPHVWFTGSPSASAGSGFTIGAAQELASVSGIFFYSTQGAAAAPFQGGFLCVLPPTRRTPLQVSTGSGACRGVFALDFNATIASGFDPALVSGAGFWGQYWSRDSASPSTTNLTDAIHGVVGP